MITDVFINAVYLTDEGLTFGLNFIDGVETIPLRDWNQAAGSDSLRFTPPNARYSRVILAVPGVFFIFHAADYRPAPEKEPK